MKYFNLSDFACKCGCGLNNMDLKVLGRIDRAREIAGLPFIVLSGCRCKAHNKNEGGSDNSSHLSGLAVDLLAEDSSDMYEIFECLKIVGFVRFGINNGAIHVDDDPAKPQRRIFTYY